MPSTYAHPEVLVSTQWVADHLSEPTVRLLEAGWNTSEYDSGHISGAIGCGFADFHQPGGPDVVNKQQIEALLSQAGISNSDTVVLYGGLSNLVAALAFWILKLYGHGDVRLLDGGRQKWVNEERELITEKPVVQPTHYVAYEQIWELRADKDVIGSAIGQPSYTVIDARSVEMYAGATTAGIEHGGHIPTAVNVPASVKTDAEGNSLGWQTPTTSDTGTFKSADELHSLFSKHGVTPDKTIITYCVVGGLSSHMWFVLTQLLGYPNVREYDRSWAEWGNLGGAQIEK
jgi:thiosulfate/3-mercaptopyruvate sulfurtransferase